MESQLHVLVTVSWHAFSHAINFYNVSGTIVSFDLACISNELCYYNRQVLEILPSSKSFVTPVYLTRQYGPVIKVALLLNTRRQPKRLYIKLDIATCQGQLVQR